MRHADTSQNDQKLTNYLFNKINRLQLRPAIHWVTRESDSGMTGHPLIVHNVNRC